MSDTGASRLQHKGSRRGAHRKVGSSKPFQTLQADTPQQGFDPAGRNDHFGRSFEPQNGNSQRDAGLVQEVHNASYTPHSESSESDRISALHGKIYSRILPQDTPGLQQYMADLDGELGRIEKVKSVVSGILRDRSECQRLSAELKEERERSAAAEEQLRSRLAAEEAKCRAEAARVQRLQSQVTTLQERERELQHALHEAQRHVCDRESVLAHWKDERRAAEADATNKVAAAEALASRREEELREAQAAEGKRNADMVAAIDRWRDIVKGKDEQVSHLQAQVWHFQNEIGQMDAHYRHELDALVAAKAAVDAEVQKLRTAAAAAVPSLPQPIVPGPLQPALSTFPPPSAPTAAHTKDSATPTPSASLPAPQKGIKNGSVVDATQRSVASELHMIMNGRSVHNAPELLLEQDLVDILVDIVPRGEAHARRISGSDYQKLEAALGGRRWDQYYQEKYGTVAEFMKTHPEAFYQSTNGTFYRPDAPSRLPKPAATSQQPALPAPLAGPGTAVIVPTGTAEAPVPPKRPAVVSALVTPAAPAHLRTKRNGPVTTADAKQPQPAQSQPQPQQQQPPAQQQPVAAPVSVAPGSGRPQRAVEKGGGAASVAQPEQKPQGYLQAAKGAQQPPQRSAQLAVEEFPTLNGGSSSSRQNGALAKEAKPALCAPPGLQQRQSGSAGGRQSKEADNGGDAASAAPAAASMKGNGEKQNRSSEPAANCRGSAQGPASVADGASAVGEKQKKKRNRKGAAHAASATAIVGAA